MVALVEHVRASNIRDIRERGGLDDYLARLSDGYHAYQQGRYTGDARNVAIFKEMGQLAEQPRSDLARPLDPDRDERGSRSSIKRST